MTPVFAGVTKDRSLQKRSKSVSSLRRQGS